MPQTLKVLYKPYRELINGIQPLVPALWTGDPATPGLKPIEDCYPNKEVVRCRIQDVITMAKSKDGLVCSNKKVITNPKPLEDLLSEGKAGPNCELVRDYNGEYAPCIAAVLGGGSCCVVQALKPSSMRATISAAGPKLKDPFKGCPADDAEATKWLTEKIRTTPPLPTTYHQLEEEKRTALGTALFSDGGLEFRIKGVSDPQSMNVLHQFWRQNEIPARFYNQVKGWRKERKNHASWASSIYHEAPLAQRNRPDPSKAKEHSSPVVDKATVQPQTIAFALWIRWQLPQNHSHNMGQDLLDEIVTAISQVCRFVYPKGTNFLFVLFGDKAAKTSVDAKGPEELNLSHMPLHRAGRPNNAKTSIPEVILDTFLKGWAEDPPFVQVRDFRDLYNPAYFTTPKLADFTLEADWRKAEAREQAKAYRDKNPRKANYSYWEQYSFFQFIDQRLHPRFIIGAESGNMDGFGYCGIPVISVDVEDQSATEESILTDRIGQYCLLTPLWNLLNYHRGKEIDVFRQLLYGSVLMYTEYAGQLHETKWPTAKGPKPQQDSPLEDWNSDDPLLKLMQHKAEGEVDVIVESLQAQYHIIDVKGDGNCLFRALSRTRTDTEDRHLLYRQNAVDYAADNFPLAMIQAGSVIQTIEDYRGTMTHQAGNAEDENRWGGFVEIEAFALREQVTVEVYSPGLNDPVISNPGKAEIVRILYINRNHYKAIRPKV